MMTDVDVLVVGGGIAGVGVAQFASAAGYKVMLVERGRVGSETSANSSKLIHGGLRYLESFQLDLVRKSLKERRALLELAPELVKPVPFYIPVYRDSQRGSLTIRAGLSLYGLLSEFDSLGRFRTVASKDWESLSGLKTDGLETVFQYWDAQTDDRKLSQAVAHSAVLLGASILEQTQVQSITHDKDGCEVVLSHAGNCKAADSRTVDSDVVENKVQASTTQMVRAAVVVNACGPWVNQLLDTVIPPIAKLAIDWVQGAHLLLDVPPPDGILYLESPIDRRVVFVMPWYDKTLVGTTETRLSSLADVAITEAEVRYLLALYSHYFPKYGDVATLEPLVCGRFCGVRVLPKLPGDVFNAPRDTLMHSDPTHPRLLSIYGGKLTTFRSSAGEVCDWIAQTIGPREVIADVHRLKLTIAPVRDDFIGQTG